MLIPLLGTHFIIFILVNPESKVEPTNGEEVIESAKIFFEVVLTSFEGIMSKLSTEIFDVCDFSFGAVLFHEH